MPLAAGSKVRASTAPGWVAESLRTTNVGSITTTETTLQSVTFSAVSTARYKITAIQSIQSTIAGDLIQMRLKVGGTEIFVALPNADTAGKGAMQTLIGTVTGLSGSVTASVTAVRGAGATGTVSSFGSASQQANLILVERV